MRRITAAERRHRLVARHHLARTATDPIDAATDLVGLHSSDPATPYLSLRARVAGFEIEDLEVALYDRRSLLRMLGMRRTLFVQPRAIAVEMDAACTRTLLDRERKRLIAMVEDQLVDGDGGEWVDRVCDATVAALRRRGEATARDLTEDVPELSLKLTHGEGRKWGGEFGVSTRILFLLATAGRIIRARPLGTWLSSQYHWAPLDEWADGGLEAVDQMEARCRLAGRYLRSFGPATETDLRWWTGWNVRPTRATLAAVGAVEVQTDSGPALVLPDDVDEAPPPRPAAAFLPGLDSSVMGWKERGWYLGSHQGILFDRNGNAGPTVWWDGRVVGGWAQRDDATVVLRILEDVGSEAEQAIDDAAHQLEMWLDGTRVSPRFRTPLEREMTG